MPASGKTFNTLPELAPEEQGQRCRFPAADILIFNFTFCIISKFFFALQHQDGALRNNEIFFAPIHHFGGAAH